MADSGVILDPGSGGPTVDTETGRNGWQMQRFKLVNGALDVDGGDVTPTNPFPVYQAQSLPPGGEHRRLDAWSIK